MPQPNKPEANICMQPLIARIDRVTAQALSGVRLAERLSASAKPAPLRAPSANPCAGNLIRSATNQTPSDLADSSMIGTKKDKKVRPASKVSGFFNSGPT